MMATTAVEKERKTLADREQIETHSRILTRLSRILGTPSWSISNEAFKHAD